MRVGAVRELFVYVLVESDGEERILGMRDDGGWVALIGETKDAAEQLHPIARRLSMELHRDIKLLKFSTREEVTL